MQSAQAAAPVIVRATLPRRAGILLFPALVIGIWLLFTPGGLLGKADAIGYAVCHRIDLRSFHLGVRALPLCARCTGMHLGALLAIGFLTARGRGRAGLFPRPAILAAMGFFAVVFAIDGVNSYLHFFPSAPHLYPPSNLLRLITGLLLGIGLGTIVYAGFNQTVWADWRPEPVIHSARDLTVVLLLGALVLAAVVSENPLILYPLALLSALSVILLLTIVYSMIGLIIAGRDNKATSWRELMAPLAFGLGVTFLQIGLFDLARYWLTGTWSGFTL